MIRGAGPLSLSPLPPSPLAGVQLAIWTWLPPPPPPRFQGEHRSCPEKPGGEETPRVFWDDCGDVPQHAPLSSTALAHGSRLAPLRMRLSGVRGREGRSVRTAGGAAVVPTEPGEDRAAWGHRALSAARTPHGGGTRVATALMKDGSQKLQSETPRCSWRTR